jgi:hypothetical protein
MKNIHLISTDNYSQLVNSTSKYGGLFLSKYYSPMKDMGDSYQNIYITNSEEIKEDYVFAYGVVIKVMMFDEKTLYFVNGTKAKREDCKKIILTTDQDLIKDGVQAIDDEFLEWFVRNPSCESVEVADIWKEGNPSTHYSYQLIIPQEEPKQEIDMSKYISGIDPYDTQETLEEAASRLLYSKYPYHPPRDSGYWKDMFISGAKWQAERMYSEEEVLNLWKVYIKLNDGFMIRKSLPTRLEELIDWFEQNKKK